MNAEEILELFHQRKIHRWELFEYLGLKTSWIKDRLKDIRESMGLSMRLADLFSSLTVLITDDGKIRLSNSTLQVEIWLDRPQTAMVICYLFGYTFPPTIKLKEE